MDKEEIRRCQERSKIARSLIRRRKKSRAQNGDHDFSISKKKKLAAMLKKSDDLDSSSEDEDSNDGDFERYDPLAFSDQTPHSVMQIKCGSKEIITINDEDYGDDHDNVGVGVGLEYAGTIVRKGTKLETETETGLQSAVELISGKDSKKRKLGKKQVGNDLAALHADDLIPEMGERVFSWVTRYFFENKVTQNLLFDDDIYENSQSSSSAILSHQKVNTPVEDMTEARAGAGVCTGSYGGYDDSSVGYGTGPKHPLYFQYQGHSRTIIGSAVQQFNSKIFVIFD
jgi:hypothetical protein